MDPGSRISRVERTFWAVWNYITEAVNRFLSPEPINTETEESPLQAHLGDHHNADGSHGEADGQTVTKENPPDSSFIINSVQPAVAQLLCNSDDTVTPEQGQLTEITEDQESELLADYNDIELSICKAAEERSDQEPNRQLQASDNVKFKESKTSNDNKIEIRGLVTGEESMRAMMQDEEGYVKPQIKSPNRIQVQEEILHMDEKQLEKEDADILRMTELKQSKVINTGVKYIDSVSNLEKEMQQPIGQDELDNASETIQVSETKRDFLQREEIILESDDANMKLLMMEDLAKENNKHKEEVKTQSVLDTENHETVCKLALVDKSSIHEAQVDVESMDSVEQEFNGYKSKFTDICEMNRAEKDTSILRVHLNNQTTNVGEVEGKENQSDRNCIKHNEEVHVKIKAEMFQSKDTKSEVDDLDVQTRTKEAICDDFIENTAKQNISGEEIYIEKDNVQPVSFVCVKNGVIKKGPSEITGDQILNSPANEETQKGILEHTNEPAPEKSKIQWFIEAKEQKETHVGQLQEEVANQGKESVESPLDGRVFSVESREQGNYETVTEELTEQEDFLHSKENGSKKNQFPAGETEILVDKGMVALLHNTKNISTEPTVEELECGVTATESQQQQQKNEDMSLSCVTEERVSEVRNTADPVVGSLVRLTEEHFITPVADENRLQEMYFSQEADNMKSCSEDTTESITGQKFEICLFKSPSLVSPNELQGAINQLSDKTSEDRQSSFDAADDLETTTWTPNDLTLTTLEDMSKNISVSEEEEANNMEETLKKDEDLISSEQTVLGKEKFNESVSEHYGDVHETKDSTTDGVFDQSVNELNRQEPVTVISVQSSTQQIMNEPQEAETEQSNKTSDNFMAEMQIFEGPAAVEGFLKNENSETQSECGMSSSTALLDQCQSERDMYHGGISLLDLASSEPFQDLDDTLAPDLSREQTNIELQETADIKQSDTVKETAHPDPAPHSNLQIEVSSFELDFTAQKSRILVKNPSVRRPKDPRSLLQKPSIDPTPASSSPHKIPVGVSFGGVGLKLPGLGVGFPVLKKTNSVKEKRNTEVEHNAQVSLGQQEAEAHTEEKSTDEEQQRSQRPRWKAPSQPGFSNPLMSELKTRLRKTPED